MMKVNELLRCTWARTSVAVSVVVLLYVWCTKGLSSAEMASWVQALGALFAIAIAIFLARSSAQREDDVRAQAAKEALEAARTDRQAQVKAACLLAETVCAALLKGYDALEKRLSAHNFSGPLPVFAVRQGREAILRVPAHQIPYTVLGLEFLTITIYADQYLQLTSEMRKATAVSEVKLVASGIGKISDARKRVEIMQEAFRHVRKTYNGVASLPITEDDI